MLRKRFVYRHLLTAVLCFTLILSGFSFQVLAEEGAATVTGTLTLGNKEPITFEDTGNKYYEVTVPGDGLYRIDYYSTYHNNYNDDFWVGIYRSLSDAENMSNLVDTNLGIHNNDNADTDYEIYRLSAGTYYLCVQAFDIARPVFGIMVSAATDDDLYELQLGGASYAGMDRVYVGVGYYDPKKDKSYEGKVTSVTSSNNNVVKVVKDTYYNEKGKKATSYHLKYVKAGAADITVKYTRPNGQKAVIKKTLQIKKYPNMIKSLKVNGKTVKTSKNKFQYSVNKFKKTSAKIKMATKNGWKVKEVTADYYGKSYKYKELKKSVVTKGTAISFPKKFNYMIIYIYMENKSGDQITYEVDLFR